MTHSNDIIDDAFTGTFTSKGLMLAEHMGVFDHFDTNGNIEEKRLREIYIKKPSHIDAIIKSLENGNIISVKSGICTLNVNVGKIKNKLSIFNLWIHSYRDLLSIQEQTFDKDLEVIPYDGGSVAKYSAEIGAHLVDKTLEEIFDKINISGTICDMGCGAGLRLINICRNLRINGIGMDIDANAINLANKNAEELQVNYVKFNKIDVTNINEIYHEVKAITFTFFTHHVIPNKRLSDLFLNYKVIFPDLKYMIVFDTVTSEDKNTKSDIFANGFDYIHRLQGIMPRTRKDYLSIFKDSNLSIINEIKLEVDNSYVWICKVS